MAEDTGTMSADATDLPFSSFWQTEPGTGHALRNLAAAALVEAAIQKGEGMLTARGALAVRTGSRTGRSPKDRYIVAEPPLEQTIDWNNVNRPLSAQVFERLTAQAQEYLTRRTLYIADGYAGADPRYRISVRVVTETAWHSLFARTLLRRPEPSELARFRPDYLVVCLPNLRPEPSAGPLGDVCVAISFCRRTVLILGTAYAGEIKKSVFSVMNFLLPRRGVLSMHCSANVGNDGRTALFFGLSGTGKTTLSAEGNRRLVGDDEHGWTDAGIFNIEGGCYAKTYKLSAEHEPQIYHAIRFGSILENVMVSPLSREPDYFDKAITENGRATYPLEHIESSIVQGQAGHPSHICFLTCDAFGVLPPVSRLSLRQSLAHFLAGYTAKVAGTENGIVTPQATFSTCFAAPFLPLAPMIYAQLLYERLAKHRPAVWLINTGWVEGPAGQARRMPLEYTRAIVRAALSGQLDESDSVQEPLFGLRIPSFCPGVPQALLRPRHAWRDPAAYDAQATLLRRQWEEKLAAYHDFLSQVPDNELCSAGVSPA